MSSFLRFCVVGGIGFLTDAGILYLLTELLELGPYAGRAISFSVAVTTTWLLNRSWAFRTTDAPSLREFLSYLSVQGFGLGCNLAIYVGLVAFVPAPLSDPVAAVTIASAVALIVNYAGLRRFVFSGRS